MGDLKGNFNWKRKENHTNLVPALDFLKQIPSRLQDCLKSRFEHLAKTDLNFDSTKPQKWTVRESLNELNIDLDKQMQTWRENPNWVDQAPEIEVTVPKGSLCNLKVKLNVGLPPDAIYNIVIDPGNKRVFKNIKEVISRNVLFDDGQKQVVEVEQAAIWRFLWFSGTISVHVFVEQDRKDHTVKFKQGKSGFMEKFEGCWKVEPLFVDEHYCLPNKPKSWDEYNSCTGGKGRIGSVVSLDQLIQPAIIPPPPISWYLRGITSKTTEMLINDLLEEAARLRAEFNNDDPSKPMRETVCFDHSNVDQLMYNFDDTIKKRWHQRRSHRRK